MIRATLDVNVLASGFAAGSSVPATLIDHWTQFAYELVLSEHILMGLERIWQKPYFQRRYHSDLIRQSLALLRSEATVVARCPPSGAWRTIWRMIWSWQQRLPVRWNFSSPVTAACNASVDTSAASSSRLVSFWIFSTTATA